MHPSLVLAFSAGGDLGRPLLSGLVSGAVYGLLALGIVLVYKANRIFNFAQAEFGSVAALIALAFLEGLGPFPQLPYPAAVLLGLVAGTLTGLLTERLVIRPLFNESRATLLVATAGVALFLIGAQLVLLGVSRLHFFPKPLGHHRYSFFGSTAAPHAYVFGWAEIDAVVTLVLLAVAAVLFFRSRYGVAILAVSQDPTAADLVGVNVRRISALTWTLAGFLGAVGGLLYAPIQGVTPPGFFTDIAGVGPIIFGFIAAVLGGITSLPGAFVGGIAVGEINAFAGTYVPKLLPALPGSGAVTLAVLLLVVLLLRPTGLLGRET